MGKTTGIDEMTDEEIANLSMNEVNDLLFEIAENFVRGLSKDYPSQLPSAKADSLRI